MTPKQPPTDATIPKPSPQSPSSPNLLFYTLILISVVMLVLCSTGCAMTKSTLRTEDGALMKNWAIATAGSKITGRDLQQSYSGATPEGYQWQATTGEQTDQLQNDTATLTLLLQLLGKWGPSQAQ